MEVYSLLDENSGFLLETPIWIPLKWRYNNVVTQSCIGKGLVGHSSGIGTLPCSVTGVSDWYSGGEATVGMTVRRTSYPYAIYAVSLKILNHEHSNYPHLICSHDTLVTTETNVEIDWEASLAGLKTSYPGSGYTIGAVKFADSEGKLVVSNVSESAISLDNINAAYKSDNPEISNLLNFNIHNSYDTQSVKVSTNPDVYAEVKYVNNIIAKGFTDSTTGINWADTCANLINEDKGPPHSHMKGIPMYIKVWVKSTILFSAGEPAVFAEVGDLFNADMTAFNCYPGSGTGGGGTGTGSGNQGMNTFQSNYGNSNIPFHSIYLTGANYNSFIAAGGGIVSNSGVYPQSDTMYIEKISVDIEGSSATIVEVVDFDATPLLTVGDRLYLYLFDDTNNSKPVFYGFITSQKRVLTEAGQEIQYECKDLMYFLNQFYTPSHYIYRPPSYGKTGVTKTYDRVIKEILNVAGIPNAVIDIPEYNAPPTTWIYQPLQNVLEWAASFFGNYVFFVDRYGRLNFKAITSGSVVKSYAIGDKTIANPVESFEPVMDYSRSRSRIVLTGDFEVTEKRIVSEFGSITELNPNDNENQTGIFYFFDTTDEDLYDETAGTQHMFYYFMFKPGETLNDKLLTDNTQSCRVTIKDYVDEEKKRSDKIMSPRVFRTTPGDSEIYVEGDEFKQGRRIEVIYAVRSDSPIQVHVDTGLTGGTEVVRRPEFKKATSLFDRIDDTPLMTQYINKLKDYYKPVYGGTLVLDGLDLDIALLDKVSLTGTDLPAAEAASLAIYSITWDCVNKRTTVELSNKSYADLPFFDDMRERSRASNELLAKMGLIEEELLYKRIN